MHIHFYKAFKLNLNNLNQFHLYQNSYFLITNKYDWLWIDFGETTYHLGIEGNKL